jgi:hypothetical protein
MELDDGPAGVGLAALGQFEAQLVPDVMDARRSLDRLIAVEDVASRAAIRSPRDVSILLATGGFTQSSASPLISGLCAMWTICAQDCAISP